MKLRQATIKDARIFYKARFSEEAVKNSKDKDVPNFKQHCKWFKKQDFNNMYIIEDDIPVGYIRIDKSFVSIAVLPEMQHKGLASFGLSKIVKKYKNLKTEIYKFNLISLKLFNKFPEIKIIYL